MTDLESKILMVMQPLLAVLTAITWLEPVNEWIKFSCGVATLILFILSTVRWFHKRKREKLEYKIREMEFEKLKAENLERYRPK